MSVWPHERYLDLASNLNRHIFTTPPLIWAFSAGKTDRNKFWSNKTRLGICFIYKLRSLEHCIPTRRDHCLPSPFDTFDEWISNKRRLVESFTSYLRSLESYPSKRLCVLSSSAKMWRVATFILTLAFPTFGDKTVELSPIRTRTMLLVISWRRVESAEYFSKVSYVRKTCY